MHKDLETRTSQHRRPYDVYRFSQRFSDGQKSLMSVWSLSSTHFVPAPVWAKPSSPGDLRLNTFNECHIITFGASPYTRYLRIAVTPSAAHYAFALLRLRASQEYLGEGFTGSTPEILSTKLNGNLDRVYSLRILIGYVRAWWILSITVIG